MTPAELQEHIYKTYFWLRGGLCLLAFVFPFLLWGIGSWNEIPLQNSISDYYFAFAPPNSELRAFPGRVVFVGVLFALGFFLILYRGFSSTENWTLNIAGLSALIAFVAWACSEETLVQLPEPKRRYFRMGYYALAIIMVVTPAAVITMTYIFGIYDKWIFIVETVGIVMFSAYWALKSYELSMSKAEKKAMMGQMQTIQIPAERPSLRLRAARLLD